MKIYILFLTMLLSIVSVFSQIQVTGAVMDDSNNPIPGANVLEKGTSNGTTADIDGNYSLSVSENATLSFSYVGYSSKEIQIGEQTTVNATLVEGTLLEDVVIVGSRSPKRTSTETAVPVDVINIEDVATQSGKVEINQLLQFAAPSFNATKQSGADGADHIDPATLRGLGPDQTLVLINGKRRHQSSLVNLFGTRGRGNTGTDLNAIPSSAIKRIEILRDGAAAQYGSDAIAGVINIVLKDNTDGFSGFVSYGAYNTDARGDFEDNAPNTPGFRLDTERDGNQIADDKHLDGGSIKTGLNYGLSIGEKGGFANMTLEYISKNKTLRPGFDFRRGFGEAAIDGFNLLANVMIPVSENTEFYAFGGRNYRETDAFAFTRNNPTERNVIPIYPDGFTPRITSNIVDLSIATGIKTKTKNGWHIDLSNTYGKNNFHYFIKGTLNASLQRASPTEFDAGGHELSQNTINFDVSKYFKDVSSGFNIAFGAEYRTENFIIFAGEQGSYATYDIRGVAITDPQNQSTPTDPITGEFRPGGSQGFPGYSPANEVDESRTNISLYADSELDITESFLVSVAGRFEKYSDFGSTTNGKLSSRLKLSDNINLRGSFSTGFRAPSLAQIYYNLRFTNFVGGRALETVLSSNNSPVTASFGIGPLTEEKTINAGFGLTGSFGNFTASIDYYHISIDDRIVLTGNFNVTSIQGVDDAQFFVNGVDTQTNGLDIVASWKKKWNNGSLDIGFIGNINNLSINRIQNGDLDLERFFGARDRAFLNASAPDSKFSLNAGFKIDWFSAGVSFTRFSEVEFIDFQVLEDPQELGYDSFEELLEGAVDTYGVKITTDVVLGFEISDQFKFILGSNNLFNIYPDQQDDWTSAGGYWDSVQMGFSGAYYYSRLNYKF